MRIGTAHRHPERARAEAAAAPRRHLPTMVALSWAGTALLLALLLLGTGGCSDQGSDPVAPVDADPPPPPAVSYASDIQPIWDANCLDCHAAGGSAGLDLRAPASLAELVNATASGYPGLRVVPGDPHISVLYLKLEGDPTTGARMPFGGAQLSAADRILIHDWIEQGALDN